MYASDFCFITKILCTGYAYLHACIHVCMCIHACLEFGRALSLVIFESISLEFTHFSFFLYFILLLLFLFFLLIIIIFEQRSYPILEPGTSHNPPF